AVWWLNPPFTGSRALVLAVIVAVAAPLGDLAESALKHDAGIAEPPGGVTPYGSVLDRLDGLLFAAPAFYLAYRAMIR
ncbi:MAG: phosphatidate cytidylyltransferase, partial [Actinomycetota bacterium]